MVSTKKVVLLTGATGFIGKHVASRLLSKDVSVVSVGGRSSSGRADISCDFSRPFDMSSSLNGVTCVIHLAAVAHSYVHRGREDYVNRVNVEATVELARQAASCGVDRFVFLSTIGVYGDSSKEPIRSDSETNPHDLYSESKLRAENCLREVARRTGLDVVIVRPPLVYGDNAPGNFSRLRRLISLGVPLPFASIQNARSFISVWNLADFLLACTQSEEEINDIFVVSDGEDLSTVEFMQEIALAMGKRCLVFQLPPMLVFLIFLCIRKKLLFKKLFSDLVVDSSYARQRLTWEPSLSLREGMELTMRSLGDRLDQEG